MMVFLDWSICSYWAEREVLVDDERLCGGERFQQIRKMQNSRGIPPSYTLLILRRKLQNRPRLHFVVVVVTTVEEFCLF